MSDASSSHKPHAGEARGQKRKSSMFKRIFGGKDKGARPPVETAAVTEEGHGEVVRSRNRRESIFGGFEPAAGALKDDVNVSTMENSDVEHISSVLNVETEDVKLPDALHSYTLHSSLVCYDESRICLFADGLGKLFSYHCETNEWTQQPTSGSIPTISSSHCYTAMSYPYAFLFVERPVDGAGARFPMTLDYYEFDFRTLSWSAPKVHGDKPVFVACPAVSMCSDKGGITFIGGQHVSSKPMIETAAFIPAQHCWYLFSTSGEVPNGRVGHAVVSLSSEELLLHGGFQPETGQHHNDSFVLDLRKNAWTYIRQRGYAPKPRYGHALSIWKGMVVLHGGISNGGVLSDVCVFDMDRLEWAVLHSNDLEHGAQLQRFGHKLTLFPHLIFGGWVDVSVSVDDVAVRGSGSRNSCVQDVLKLALIRKEAPPAVPVSAYREIVESTPPVSDTLQDTPVNEENPAVIESDVPIDSGSPTAVQPPSASLSPPSPTRSSPTGMVTKMQELGVTSTAGDDRPSFQLTVNLAEYHFEAEPALERPVVNSIQDLASLPADFEEVAVGELGQSTREYLQQVYSEFSSASEGGEMTALDYIAFIRKSSILDNTFTWEQVDAAFNRVLQRTFGIHGDEPISQLQFEKLTVVIAYLHHGVSSASPSVAMNELISEYIYPYCMGDGGNDNNDDAAGILTPQVLSLFAQYRKRLREVFATYATLDVLALYQPSWEEVERYDAGVSLVEFLMHVEHFEICPELVARHVITSYIFQSALPDGLRDSEEAELTYPYFLECLARCAMHAYSKHPYASMYRTPRDKVQALFTHMGLDDKKLFYRHIRRLGLRGSLRNARSVDPEDRRQTVKEQSGAASSMVLLGNGRALDERAVEKELQRIFEFYASFGNHLNTLIPSAMWAKFVRDIHVVDNRNVSSADADLVCVLVSGERQSSAVRLDYPTFVSALKLLATKKYPDSEDDDAYLSLLQEHVLLYAARNDVKVDAVDVGDKQVDKMLKKNDQVIRLVFGTYCRETKLTHGTWAATQIANNTMDFDEFQQFAKEFEICPGLVAKSYLFRIFREANTGQYADDDASAMNFAEFKDALVRTAAYVYSKYPYNGKFKSPKERMHALFQRLEFLRPERVRAKLEELGYHVQRITRTEVPVGDGDEAGDFRSASTTTVNETVAVLGGSSQGSGSKKKKSATNRIATLKRSNSVSSASSVDSARATSPRATERKRSIPAWFDIQVHPVALLRKFPSGYAPPAQEEWSKSLWSVFGYYSTLSAQSEQLKADTSKSIQSQGFIRLVRDCHIFDNNITHSIVDLVYVEVTRNHTLRCDFDKFCDALTGLAVKKFPQLSGRQAYEQLLRVHVFPFAKSQTAAEHSFASGGTDASASPEVTKVISSCEAPLRRLFTKYCLIDRSSAGQSWKSIRQSQQSLSVAEFVKLCKDFEICPKLISVPDAILVYRSVLSLGDRDADALDEEGLSLPLFCQCLIRIALEGLSVAPWSDKYVTPEDKVECIMRWLHIETPRARQKRSF